MPNGEGQKARSLLYELLDIGLKVFWIVALGKFIGWWG